MRKRLIVVAALVAACAESSSWVPYSPVRGNVQASKADIVGAAVVGLTNAGKEVDTQDANTGIVVSKWWSDPHFAQDQYRFRVRLTVTDTNYEVIALCEMKDPGMMDHGQWKPCEAKDGRPKYVSDVVASVEKAIKDVKRSTPPAMPTPPVAGDPRGFYCSSGVCARDNATCEQARLAANDPQACALTEAAHCFALTAGGESCAPNADACAQRRTTAGEAASGDCSERK